MGHESQIVRLANVTASKLNNNREVRIYLPPGYDRNVSTRYPVLYMHVGQHVFESRKKFGEPSWRMHEVLDRLIGEGKIQDLLLVAVEHKAEEGTSEYFHDRCAFPIRCVGEGYEYFLVHELKPLIDRSFRTIPGPESTGLMGSSAAGIATYNIGLRNPDVFGMLGILSPFFVQADPYTLAETKQYEPYKLASTQKVWVDIGGAEGFFLPRHVKAVAEDWISEGTKQGEGVYYYHDPDAAHSEKDWGDRAHLPLIYFFGEKGTPERAELHGPAEVGLSGPELDFNAVVRYESGFAFSDLEGRYEVDHPEILTVAPNGRIVPKAIGEATIRYIYEGVEASAVCRVVAHLTDTVEIQIEVIVPDATPADARVYATFELPKLEDKRYGLSIRLPRGMTMAFLITRGYGRDEADATYGSRPARRLVADRDKFVQFTVDNWMDLKPGMAEAQEEGAVW